MSRDLSREIRAFLAEHGPSTRETIALGVRARRAEVVETLAAGGFQAAEKPEGGNPRSVYWEASRSVPRITEGSRGGALLSILRDRKWHTRAEILETAGRAFLTNNAASELRRAGHEIEFSAKAGYRLVSLAAPGDAASSGAASEPTRDLVAA